MHENITDKADFTLEVVKLYFYWNKDSGFTYNLTANQLHTGFHKYRINKELRQRTEVVCMKL